MKKFEINWVKFILVFLTISLLVVFIFRKPIMENKYSKAKIDIFNTMINDDPNTAKENIKVILDTLMNKDKKKEAQ